MAVLKATPDDPFIRALRGNLAQLAQSNLNPSGFDTTTAPGMIEPGNVDPWNRPVLRNPDGSYSTTSSISIGTDRGEVLIPTVIGGKRLSEDEARKYYRDSGQHLGIFETPEQADAYAQALHSAQMQAYDAKGNLKGKK